MKQKVTTATTEQTTEDSKQADETSSGNEGDKGLKIWAGPVVLLPELGKFEVKRRKARAGVNPNTGEKIEIAEKKTVTLKPSKQFLEELNST